MKLSLLRIAAGGQTFEHRYAPDELDVSAHAFTLNEPAHVSGRVKPSGQDFHVTGELETHVAISCDRCLRDLFIPVHETFKLVYVPANEARSSHGEREVSEQELDFVYLDGDELDPMLDIDQLTRDQLELALPTRILCRDDCRGLCAQCGADLNETTCQCAATVDPRWQALADLRNQND
ncbi:MAG: DUF177 domain-containing protein [Acidobacteria bacterium]|nr:DUF177 domain-containing protein [Acidobacteriota bacterium]